MRIHIVQKGETLWRIAKQYGIGLDELKRLNTHLANPDYIVPGMEIILPEEGTATPKTNMTKEQQTAPAPSKEKMTAPKEKLTEPKVKEQPVREVPKQVETAPIPAPIPAPVPMPIPQVDLMPQFQFDFAPQMHFEQPQHLPAPAPQPMPQPQPIYIQVPQPKVETKHETTIEKDVEYVHIPVPQPQPQIIYVCCPQPQPQPQPCGCHEQVYYHNPCGCHEQAYYHNPCGCQDQQYHQPHPCGCDEHANYHYGPYDYNEDDYQQMPQQQYNDCGCGGGGYPSQEMMQYGMPNFEPNYDMAPMTDVAPAMEDPYEDHDGLPDWLLDSSEVKEHMVDQDFDPSVGAPDFEGYNPYDPNVESEQAVNPYQEGYNYGNDANPYSQNYYGPYNMQQAMPGHMNHIMPQQMIPQMMQPNCQGYPYNPYSAQNKPWNY